MSNCIVCGTYVPEGRLICVHCEGSTAHYDKKIHVALKVLDRINNEGKIDGADYIELRNAILAIS